MSWHYTWDAENRLIGMEPLLVPMEGFQKLSFGYDYMGRRVRKTVYTYNGTTETWVQTGDTKVVWAGWLLLLELDGTDSDAILRKYTWGLDVAGQNGQVNSLESAGGIGGLLGVYDTNGTTTGQNPTEDDKTYVYLYDANGNVGQLVDWTDIPDWESKQLVSAQDWHADRLVARYEYDPYGNVVGPDTDSDGDWTDDAGPYATVNAFRFSTKYWDDETGLGYWGYRYYSPTLGRWISRDPAEGDRPTVYRALCNDPGAHIDPRGHNDEKPSQRKVTLTVRTTKVDRGMCGTTIVDFDFVLSPEAPCHGYVVQEVDVAEYYFKCEKQKCTDRFLKPPKRRSKPYYEAFRVHEGDKIVRDPQGSGYTDSSHGAGTGLSTRACGKGHATGKLRFFCEDVTGYLGEYRKDGKWSHTKISWSGGLVATTQKPHWWREERHLAQASRSVTWSWDCCCETQNTQIHVVPPLQGKTDADGTTDSGGSEK